MPISIQATGLGTADPAASHTSRQRATQSRPIEFWTIAPNEGQSAGGHSALRIGELVYHLEHRDDGLIVDRRDPLPEFERVYRFEGNRSIEVVRLALPPGVEEALVQSLERRRFERRSRLDLLAGLEAEVAWLDGTLETGRAAVTVPGLGILDPVPTSCAAERGARWASLRDEIRVRLGKGSLEARIAEAREDLARSRDRLLSPTLEGGERGSELQPGGSVRRLVESVQTIAALEAIRDCRGPRTSRMRVSAAAGTDSLEDDPSAGSMRPVLRTLRARLLRDLVDLIASDRPDPGLALILGWARLAVLETSIGQGRLSALDPFAEGDASLSLRSLGVPESRIRARARAARQVADERRTDLVQSDRPIEQRLDALESAQHDLAHALRGERHRSPGRVPDGTRSAAVRYASARVSLPWSPGVTLAGLASRRDAAVTRARAFRRSVQQDLEYGLFSRNCSTELLEILDEALGTDATTAGFRSARRRDPEAATGFIPVVAGRLVARNAPVAKRERRPGFRERAIERAARRGPAGWVALRESNTITSQIYRPHPHDSIFVFFSDGPVWIRPLAGIGNLVVGLGAAGAGLLAVPWDHGERWTRGIRGVVMSIPELFFFSVRRGSFVVAPTLPSSATASSATE